MYVVTVLVASCHGFVHKESVTWRNAFTNALPFYCTLFLVLLQTEQARACIFDILKHGKSAAAKYLESAPNLKCKRMAEAFIHA